MAKEIVRIMEKRWRIPICHNCKKKFPVVSVVCDGCGAEFRFEDNVNEEWIRNNLNTRIVEGVRKLMEKKKDYIIVSSTDSLKNHLIRARHDWDVFRNLNLSDITTERLLIPKIECNECGVCNNCKKCLKCRQVFQSPKADDKCPQCNSSQLVPAYFKKFEVKNKKFVCPNCKQDNITHTKERINFDDEEENIELIKSLAEDNENISLSDKRKINNILESTKLKCPKCKSSNIISMKSEKFNVFKIKTRLVF